jgi:hypothetical protein
MGAQTVAAIPAWTWAVPLIAALVAFIGVMITVILQWRNFVKQIKSAHSLKIAEMRQAWINNLRDAMSKFQSYGVTPDLDHRAEREFYEHGTRIELMMNPKDPDYAELLECLYEFLPAKDIQDKFSANPHYVEVCQRILKREWEVLKRELEAAS